MSRAQFIAIMVLSTLIVLTAIGVVYSKYIGRKNFVELGTLRAERDAVDVEWGRLQLEQSTWATHGRVERVARKQLNMHAPSSSEVVVVRP